MLTALQWILGIALYLLAAVVLFALGERLGAPAYGAGLAAVVLVLLPLLMTSWFVRAYRRIDAQATWRQNLPGIAAIVAAVSLLLLALLARGAVADALVHSTESRPELDTLAGGPVRAVAAWLRTAAREDRPRVVRMVLPDAGSAPVVAPDAGAVRTPDASTPSAEDAGERVAEDAGAPAAEDAGEAAPAQQYEGELLLAVCADSQVNGLAALPTRHGLPDRVWVACLGEEGSVWEVRPDGGVGRVASVRMPPVGADARTSYLTQAQGADLDGDGAGDLLVCAEYLTARGGSRGGSLVWARARPEGGYAPPERIATATCSGFAAVDLDGRGGPEIVLLDYGNAYAPDPRGRLSVLSGRVGNWHTLWGMPVAREPEHLALRDVNGDGRPDAVIAHDDGTPEGVYVYPGRGLSFAPPDPSLHAPRPERITRVEADLDGDGRRDDVVESGGQTVRIRRGRPLYERRDAPAPQALAYPP